MVPPDPPVTLLLLLTLHSRDSGTKYRMVWYTYDVDVDVDVDVLSLEYLLRS